MAPKKTRARRPSNLDPSIAEILAAKPAHVAQAPTRSRASYDLQPETIAAVKELARELEVSQRLVTQKLLDFALEAVERGELELRRTPIVTTSWGLE